MDGCIRSIPVKRVLSPSLSSIFVGDKCTVRWMDGEYEATVLAKGMFILLA